MSKAHEVHFNNVGRDKKSWRATVPDLTHKHMIREVRKHAALMSRDVEFDLDGTICVGGWRVVGRWTCCELEASE